jgi:hypothetical protein
MGTAGWFKRFPEADLGMGLAIGVKEAILLDVSSDESLYN